MKNRIRKIMAVLLTLTLMSADVGTIAESVIHTLTLPKALQIIEEEAFYGNTSIGKVVVPDGTTEIHARAFAQSTLKEINLPGSLTFIDDTAFEGLTGLTVTAREGSWAYDWALSKGYISPANLNIEKIEVDCGEISVRNGEVYWENISGHRQSSHVSGIEADGEWRLESSDEWIAIISEETDGGTQSSGVEFEENRTGASRTGAIDVVCGGTIRTITVVQLPYLEARLLAPEVLARDGVWETYYDEELDEYVDAKDGNYPVLDFEDLETVWEAVDGISAYELWVEPPHAGEQCYDIQSDGSDTVSGTALKCYMDPGSKELTFLYTCIYDEEHDYYYAGTQYAFYISGEGLNDYSICFDIDFEVDEIISAEITGYYGKETDLVIPDTLLDYPVTRINYGAFSGNTRITSVVIPNSVEDISGEAFLDCTGLTSVTVPESVEWIDNDAFSGCTNLEHFYAVEGSYAYDWALKHNILPEITVTPTPIPEPSEITENGVVYYLDNGTATVTDYVGNDTSVEIPAQVRGYPVTEIGDNAFEASYNLRSIGIPKGVTAIGNWAFAACFELESISIPEGVTSIGQHAFDECTFLRSIDIPDSVSSIGWGAFFRCSDLTSITIPYGVTSIQEWAFGYCESLVSINIPASVISIGEAAFKECSKLSSVNIPDGITSIGWGTFYGCSSLASIYIPDSVTSIGQQAFSGRSSDLTIYGEPGSCAEIYASEQGIPFNTEYYEEVILPTLLISVGGQVCTEDERALQGVKVTLYYNEIIYVGETETDSEGKWSFDNLQPNQSYTVYFKCDGYVIDTSVFFAGYESITDNNAVAVEGVNRTLSFIEPIRDTEVSANNALYMNWTEVEGAAYYRYSARHLNQEEAFIFRRKTEDSQAWIPVTQLIPGETLQLWAAAFGESDDDMLSQQIIRVQVQPVETGDSTLDHEHLYGDPYNVGVQWYRACVCGDVIAIIRTEYESEANANGNVTLCPHDELASFCCICYGCHDWDLTDNLIPTLKCYRCDLEISGISAEELYYKALNAVPEGGNPLEDNWITAVLYDRMKDNIPELRIERIISALKEAPPNYRDVYLYTVFEYKLVKTSGTMRHQKDKILVNTSNYSDPFELLSVWFHEVAHAVDYSAGYMSMSKQGDETILFNMLYSDAYCTIINEISKLEAENPALYSWTADEKKKLAETILDPFAEVELKKRVYIAMNKNDNTFEEGSFESDLYKVSKRINSFLINHHYVVNNSAVMRNSQMEGDIWGGLTNNYIGSGHDVLFVSDKASEHVWYNADQTPTYAQCREAFAEFFSAKILRYGTNIKNNAAVFPTSTRYMDQMVDMLLRYYKNKHD